jgi:hypothetical protein
MYLTSAVDGGEWSASRPGRFTPGKELPVPRIGHGVGFRAGVNAAEKKIVAPSMN